MRRGNRKLRALKSNIYKDGKKVTTLYKTAIRVTSRPGQCNYVVLDRDPQQVVFNNTGGGATKAPFMGDMTFYGYADMIEAMNQVYQETFKGQQGGTGWFDRTTINTGSLNALPAGQTVTNRPSGAPNSPFNTNLKTIYGKNYYQLYVKSAITGANCFVTLYKCKARFDITQLSYFSELRGGSSNNYQRFDTSSISGTVLSGTSDSMKILFNSVNNLHKAGWLYQFGQASSLGITQTAEGTIQNLSVADLQLDWPNCQEGTTLYDNKVFLKFFKIVKKFNAELMPGQKAKLSMKQKPKFFNPLKDLPGMNNCIAKKGQVFFVLKLQGAWGHENLQLTAGDQNTFQGADPNRIPTDNNSFYKGGKSRIGIGIMPAAVDVVCMKKFKTCSKIVSQDVIRNITKVADYDDDGFLGEVASTKYIDSAPSDYNASAAVIN